MKLGTVADTQSNNLFPIENLSLFDRTGNNISVATFHYKLMTIMTLQPMAYDLRCAMMMFASVDCSLRLIYMDWKRPEKWIEIKCGIEISVATIKPRDYRSPTK